MNLQDNKYIEETPEVVVDSRKSKETVASEAATSFEGYKINQVILFIFVTINILIGFRFVLKLLGANTDSGFVTFIYSLSNIFVAPFVAIFGNQEITEGAFFESASVIAFISYVVLAYLLTYLVKVLATKPVTDTN